MADSMNWSISSDVLPDLGNSLNPNNELDTGILNDLDDIVCGLFDTDVGLSNDIQGEIFDDGQLPAASVVKQENDLLAPGSVEEELPLENNFNLLKFANGSAVGQGGANEGHNGNHSALNAALQSVSANPQVMGVGAVQPNDLVKQQNLLLQKSQQQQQQQHQQQLQLAQLMQIQQKEKELQLQQQQIEAFKQQLMRESDVKSEEEQQVIVTTKRTSNSRQIQLHSQLAQNIAAGNPSGATKSPPPQAVQLQPQQPQQQQQQQQPHQQHQLLKLQLAQHSPKPTQQIKIKPAQPARPPVQVQQQSSPLQIQIASSVPQIQTAVQQPQSKPAQIIVQHVTSSPQQNAPSKQQQIILNPQVTQQQTQQPSTVLQTSLGPVTLQQLQQLLLQSQNKPEAPATTSFVLTTTPPTNTTQTTNEPIRAVVTGTGNANNTIVTTASIPVQMVDTDKVPINRISPKSTGPQPPKGEKRTAHNAKKKKVPTATLR